jgi:hypothetical protein
MSHSHTFTKVHNLAAVSGPTNQVRRADAHHREATYRRIGSTAGLGRGFNGHFPPRKHQHSRMTT